MKAVLLLMLYTVFFVWLIPYMTISMVGNAGAEIVGDGMFRFAKIIPMTSSMMSIMFNSEQLWALQTFRDVNIDGEGDDIPTDEYHPDNQPADIFWMWFHLIFFWFVLIALVEWKLLCYCCQGFGKISERDNMRYFDEQAVFDTDDGGESSEVAHVVGEGKDLEIRYQTKSKPQKQLAYHLERFSLRKPRACCGLCFCCKRDVLLSDLSAQV